MSNSTRKKIYTVEILQSAVKPNLWYSKKVGERFETVLYPRWRGDEEVGFRLINKNSCMTINPLHCTVVDEKIIDL